MSTLIDALPYLAGGVALVALVALFVSDRSGANEHDLSDYHEAEPARLRVPTTDRNPSLDTHLIWDDEGDTDDDILPPAPAGMDAGAPLWRALVVEAAVPTLSDEAVRARAGEWLREIAAEALAGAR